MIPTPKVALVTGTSSGFGQATLDTLSKKRGEENAGKNWPWYRSIGRKRIDARDVENLLHGCQGHN